MVFFFCFTLCHFSRAYFATSASYIASWFDYNFQLRKQRRMTGRRNVGNHGTAILKCNWFTQRWRRWRRWKEEEEEWQTYDRRIVTSNCLNKSIYSINCNLHIHCMCYGKNFNELMPYILLCCTRILYDIYISSKSMIGYHVLFHLILNVWYKNYKMTYWIDPFSLYI